MASIEEIQKVNELANELMRNKVAIDLDEALEKAQKILSINLGPKVSATASVEPVQQQPQPVQQIQPQAPTGAYQQSQAQQQPVQQQVVQQPNMSQNEFAKEIEALKTQMNQGLVKLYEELKKVIEFNNTTLRNELKMGPRQQMPTQQQPQRPVQRSVQQQSNNVEQITIEDEKPSNHPRQGAFNPGDDNVAVDKIFYYGNK